MNIEDKLIQKYIKMYKSLSRKELKELWRDEYEGQTKDQWPEDRAKKKAIIALLA